MTVHASEWERYPALIVDRMPGWYIEPADGAQAFAIGEKTGRVDVDAWVESMRPA